MSLDRLRNLLHLAYADGVLDDGELTYLQQQCEEWGISEGEFADLNKTVQAGEVDFAVPDTADAKQQSLIQMIQLIWADGNICDVELNMLALAAKRYGYSDDELDRLLDIATDGDEGLVLE